MDTEVFESCAVHAEAPLFIGDEAVAQLSDAAQLYSGEFMAGFNLPDCPEFDEWQFFRREHFQQKGLAVLDALIEASA